MGGALMKANTDSIVKPMWPVWVNFRHLMTVWSMWLVFFVDIGQLFYSNQLVIVVKTLAGEPVIYGYGGNRFFVGIVKGDDRRRACHRIKQSGIVRNRNGYYRIAWALDRVLLQRMGVLGQLSEERNVEILFLRCRTDLDLFQDWRRLDRIRHDRQDDVGSRSFSAAFNFELILSLELDGTIL